MTHKIKNPIKILALAGLILAVIASGTAFATVVDYTANSGTDYTHITGTGTTVGVISTINQQLSVSTPVQLRWKNDMKNDMDYGNAYFGLQYSSAYAGGLTWNSGSTYLQRGYHSVVTVTTSTIDTSHMPPLPTTDTLNINHKYEGNSHPWIGTDFWQTQTYRYG